MKIQNFPFNLVGLVGHFMIDCYTLNKGCSIAAISKDEVCCLNNCQYCPNVNGKPISKCNNLLEERSTFKRAKECQVERRFGTHLCCNQEEDCYCTVTAICL